MAYTEAKVKKGGHKFGDKNLHHLRVHPMDNGGHLITHHAEVVPGKSEGGFRLGPGYEGGIYEERPYKSVTFGPEQGDQALAHIAEHSGIPMPETYEGGEEEEQMRHEVPRIGKAGRAGKAAEQGED